MSEIIANMTNLGESGQDKFVQNWSELAKIMLHEQGISKKYLNSVDAEYILAKAVTDLIEDGNFSSTTIELRNTLRVNHPHSEDNEEG